MSDDFSRYPETILHFDTSPPVSVDLRIPVPKPTRDALRALGIDGCFGVLTAYNPRGENISNEENDRRSAQLEAELESSGDEFVRVDACSPDRSHCECSVALKAPLERAVEIAARYEQIAIFWFDGASFWIEPVLSKQEPVKLPVT